MFAVCGRGLLLLHLLLQGVPGVSREGTGEGKDHENMLSLPGDCLHHTSHRHSLLYQYLVWLQELLLLDAMPSKLRRVKSLLMQQFRVYWAFNGLQNFSQLSCPLWNNADPHALLPPRRKKNPIPRLVSIWPISVDKIKGTSWPRPLLLGAVKNHA